MNKPLVSVIIPTYNSAKTLEACLRSIKEQTYRNIEVILVDKFSEDGTIEIAKKYTMNIFQKGPERSTQFNFAAKKADGKYIYRVDSDFIVEPNVIEECVEKCDNEGFDAIAVHNTSDPTISFWSKVRKFERDMYKDDETNIGARFFKKSIFETVGGFDTTLVAAEDYDIHNKFLKKGFKIGKIKSEEVHIGEPKTLREITEKHFYYGKTIGDFIRKNPDRAGTQLTPIRSAYFRHWKEFFVHPILALGFLVYTFVRYFSAGLGYLAGKDINDVDISLSNKEMPFVSFVIPTYNAEEYLDNCLKSIRMQDYPKNKIEVLVIDGGSEDQTVKIARKYGARVLDNPRRDAESGKSIGISDSRGEIIALLDSDNEIAHVNWLSKMVVPLVSDDTIAGVESQYLIKDDFSMLNRYCARIKIADPLARLLASKPLVEYNRRYLILTYKNRGNPVIGANGFLWRKSVILSINKNQMKFEEANNSSLAIQNGFRRFAAVPNTGIYHYYSNGFGDFFKKRIKIGNKFMLRREHGESYWINDVSKAKFALATAYCATFVGPGIEALYQFIKTQDISWFLHPVMSFVTVLVYGRVYLGNRIK